MDEKRKNNEVRIDTGCEIEIVGTFATHEMGSGPSRYNQDAVLVGYQAIQCTNCMFGAKVLCQTNILADDSAPDF